ncbi:MAG: hypothetical protein ACRCUS_01265 [Anaerovoracaceae bacterium]
MGRKEIDERLKRLEDRKIETAQKMNKLSIKVERMLKGIPEDKETQERIQAATSEILEVAKRNSLTPKELDITFDIIRDAKDYSLNNVSAMTWVSAAEAAAKV